MLAFLCFNYTYTNHNSIGIHLYIVEKALQVLLYLCIEIA